MCVVSKVSRGQLLLVLVLIVEVASREVEIVVLTTSKVHSAVAVSSTNN